MSWVQKNLRGDQRLRIKKIKKMIKMKKNQEDQAYVKRESERSLAKQRDVHSAREADEPDSRPLFPKMFNFLAHRGHLLALVIYLTVAAYIWKIQLEYIYIYIQSSSRTQATVNEGLINQADLKQ